MKFDIVTIGSATRDVFLESNDFRDIKSREFSSGVGECLALGSKNEVQRIFFTTGGGATNAAVTFARLGLKAACITRVGHDDAGEEIIKVLRREGVDTRFIQKDSRDNTAYSTLLMHGAGERTILVYRGASERLSLDVLSRAMSPKRVLGPKHPRRFGPVVRVGFELKEEGSILTKWFYVTSLGGRLDLIKKIWSLARANKIKIAWNPGGEELKFGWTKLLPFIRQCEVFNVNREEASRLLLETESRRTPQRSEGRRFGLGSVRMTQVSPQKALKNLCGFAHITLITDGAGGAYACVRQEPELRRTPQRSEGRKFGLEKFFVSSLGTKPRNTTGAGDAFGSGFVAGLMLEPEARIGPEAPKALRARRSLRARNIRRGLDLEKRVQSALRLAILNADSVIRNMGAKAGILKKMPSRKEFDKAKITSYKQ